jgi:hypothetical protein
MSAQLATVPPVEVSELRVAGYVQAVEQRKPVAELLKETLYKSGLDHTEVLYQKKEHNPWDHFWRVFEAMAESDADLVIRFEDDARVGQHIKHNVVTWPVIRRPKFGCGWLYSCPSSVIDYIYHRRSNKPIRKRFIAGCVAVVFWRKDLAEIIPALKGWANRCPWGYAYDFCISGAMQDAGRELWFHNPPIVEHNSQVPSAFGHPRGPNQSTQGLYKAEYRRTVSK